MSSIDQSVADARRIAERVQNRLSGGLVVVAAGGTGGHMMPAIAVARALIAQGRPVILFTDARGAALPGLPADIETVAVQAGSLTGSVSVKLRTGLALVTGVGIATDLIDSRHPRAVVAFGGYPVVPMLTAARLRGLPYVLHEQNAILGRVNRLFAGSAAGIALSFERTKRLPRSRARMVLTGNPVRDEVQFLAGAAYRLPDGADGPVRLLIVGGSQGARILSDVVPDAVSLLPPAVRRRLRIVQQCRPEDLDRVKKAYREAEIPAEAASFFGDLPKRIADAHLVIARAGASTLAEVNLIGRPSILVPLPSATDDHQTANAEPMVAGGASWMLPQAEFTATELAKLLQKLINVPAPLARAAESAQRLGRPAATDDVVELVERVIAAKGKMRRAK